MDSQRSKVIAEQWKGLTEEEKQPYVDKNTADKGRYAKEMTMYAPASAGSVNEDDEDVQIDGLRGG